MTKLNKKYGFWTTSAMVIGIVIGSGVFFKADDVLQASSGSLPTALLAWFIGGAIMVVTAFLFSKIAARIEKVNGIVDYFEEAYGKTAGFNIAWFMTTVYYPCLVSVLAWVSSNYTVSLLGWDNLLWAMAVFYLFLFFTINLLSPVIAGRLQVSTTLIKLTPLIAVAVVGTIKGLLNGQTVRSFTSAATSVSDQGGGLALACLSTAFAYEGWIIATTINAEIKEAKKTLPQALVFGSLMIILVYTLYYVGIASVIDNDKVIAYGDNTSLIVITSLFGNFAGVLLNIFVVVSCLGTLNGLVMASSRGMFSIGVRDMGPEPNFFKEVHMKTNSTIHSGIAGFCFSLLWLAVWYGNFHGWFGGFMDISELPIAFLYFIYLALYLWYIRKFREPGIFNGYILPLLAGAGSIYIIQAAFHKDMFLQFTIVLAAIMITGNILNSLNRMKK